MFYHEHIRFKMKKIKIITTSHAINYGAVLQAYSFKRVLEKIDNSNSVTIINYCGNDKVAGRKIYRDFSSLKNIVYNMFVFFNFKYIQNRKDLILKFDIFKNNYLGIKGPLLTNKMDVMRNLDCEYLFCGSDQIWNLNLFNDENYFLDYYKDFSDIKYNSYAVSIAENMSLSQISLIKNRTLHFSNLSIREEKTAEWLGNILKRKVYSHIDPVFLTSSSEWLYEIKKYKSHSELKNFIFVFLISQDKKDDLIIHKISKIFNCKIVYLNLHPRNTIKADVILNVLDPIEFIELIYNASCVITDSFHATAFSIIFNKTFYNIKRSNRNIRIQNLYSKLNIEDRFVDTNTDTLSLKYIDFNSVNQKILFETDKAISYLKEALEIKHDKAE